MLVNSFPTRLTLCRPATPQWCRTYSIAKRLAAPHTWCAHGTAQWPNTRTIMESFENQNDTNDLYDTQCHFD